MYNLTLLQEKVSKLYGHKDHPCLHDQFLRFEAAQYFKGLKILHATPIFRNSIPKLLPLLGSGARVDVALPRGIPFDIEILKTLKSAGVNCLETNESVKNEYDVLLDCIGSYAHLSPTYGAVELTKSGEIYYANKKCISVDQSKIKTIEDKWGTSDGFLRACEEYKIDLLDKKIVIIGLGKVGLGIYLRIQTLSNHITVIEKDPDKKLSHNHRLISHLSKKEVKMAISTADIVITATGVKCIVEDHFDPTMFKGRTLINVGAEDEFGSAFSKHEVFNDKLPANFILSEPTRLKYLDATFALQSECIRTLLEKKNEEFKIIPPSIEIENYLLKISEEIGGICLDDIC